MEPSARVLLFLGASLITLWGIAHLFPTKRIVAGFGSLTADNRRVLTMEWLAEGFFLITLGLLPLLTLWLHGAQDPALMTLVRALAAVLALLAVASFSTLWRTSVLPNRICPWVKSAVALLYFVSTIL